MNMLTIVIDKNYISCYGANGIVGIVFNKETGKFINF